MVIPVEAIERYLAKVPRSVPRFKGANQRTLSASVYQQFGISLKPAKTPPRGRYQMEGLAFALYLQRALLFYDMRLGKTWIALNWAEHLKRSGHWIGKGLVIVHAPIALDVWEQEAPKHSNLKVHVVRTKPIEFIEALESDCDLIVVPWSGLQRIFSAKQHVKVHKYINRKSKFVTQNKMVADLPTAEIAAGPISLTIIDEIHMAKTKSTLRFKIAATLTQNCQYRLGLTGTPFGRKPFDLWAQAFLIDEGHTLGNNFNLFRAAFGKQTDSAYNSNEFEFDDKKEGLLRARMESIALSYQRSEVHDVNILTGQIELHMVGDQRKAYENALNHLIRISETEHAEMLQSFVRLRQISSGYLSFTDTEGAEHLVTFPYNPKVEWLSTFIEEDPRIQIIIFHEFTKSGEIICDVLKDAKIPHAWLYGATRNTAEIVQQFNAGITRVLVANTAKGGMSIDLPVADYVLFWESPTSPTIRQQAEARPMSRGTKILTVDDMICSGVERRVLSFIKEGRDLLQNLVHDRKLLR